MVATEHRCQRDGWKLTTSLVLLVGVGLMSCSSTDQGTTTTSAGGPSTTEVVATPDTSGSTSGDRADSDRPLKGGIVKISEVNYHAPLGDPTKEFVELANVGSQTVELQGWCLKGTGFCFEESADRKSTRLNSSH